ncbi:hypothetical protein [Enterocloster lavalensis]|uniref:hypothetical protein n=1 Tax=Enterocloster lavalensis TaxID=460384 RepID=UPI002665840B|nr:hypothetical protein [Enterocloster lavalensis]
MGQWNIICNGVCCYGRPKAAFVAKSMGVSAGARHTVMEMLMESGETEGLFRLIDAENGVAGLEARWGDDELERVFEAVYSQRLRNRREKLPEEARFFLTPIFELDHREIHVDSLPFLIYAMVRNQRCRTALKEATDREADRCYEAYRESDLREAAFFCWFLQEDRELARNAAGLLLLARRQAEGERCRVLMEILNLGYKPLRNQIKKLNAFSGDNFSAALDDNSDMAENLSRMMVQMAIAEDLGIPVLHDYLFYIVLQMLLIYEEEMMSPPAGPACTREGERCYRKLQKENPYLESYHASFYLAGNEIMERGKAGNAMGTGKAGKTASAPASPLPGGKWGIASPPEPMELLFLHYRLHPRMLAGIRLERRECEQIFSLFGALSEEEYESILLAATLCKYIEQLHRRCEENQLEELRCRTRQIEERERQLVLRQEQLAQRERLIAGQREALERLAGDQTQKIQKLENALRELVERHEKEKEELASLRSFAYQLRVGQEEELPAHGREKLEGLRIEKSLVIGGHSNWQKKMRCHFPNSQFLACDNRNFDPSILRNKRYIIFNTDILKHASYNRIMAERKKGQKILYVHGNNVERCLGELAGQL